MPRPNTITLGFRMPPAENIPVRAPILPARPPVAVAPSPAPAPPPVVVTLPPVRSPVTIPGTGQPVPQPIVPATPSPVQIISTPPVAVTSVPAPAPAPAPAPPRYPPVYALPQPAVPVAPPSPPVVSVPQPIVSSTPSAPAAPAAPTVPAVPASGSAVYAPGTVYLDQSTGSIEQVPAAGTTATDWITSAENWLASSTLISSIPNFWLVGGALVVGMMLSGGRRRR
jgi:hypothetical protein